MIAYLVAGPAALEVDAAAEFCGNSGAVCCYSMHLTVSAATALLHSIALQCA